MRKKRAILVLVVLLTLVVIGVLSVMGIDNHGAWLHDEEDGVWFQEVELSKPFIDYGAAVRAKERHQEQLMQLPAINRIGITHHPFPDGNYVIIVGFSSQRHMDELIRRNQIPSLLDGVSVIIDDYPGLIVPE